jgi:hypothetical protein
MILLKLSPVSYPQPRWPLPYRLDGAFGGAEVFHLRASHPQYGRHMKPSGLPQARCRHPFWAGLGADVDQITPANRGVGIDVKLRRQKPPAGSGIHLMHNGIAPGAARCRRHEADHDGIPTDMMLATTAWRIFGCTLYAHSGQARLPVLRGKIVLRKTTKQGMNYPAAELRGIIVMRSLQIISAALGISVYRFSLVL